MIWGHQCHPRSLEGKRGQGARRGGGEGCHAEALDVGKARGQELGCSWKLERQGFLEPLEGALSC